MAEPLSPADRSSLAAEQGPINMAVGGVMLLEGGGGLRHERILERVSSRLHLIPRYRQRLRQPAPGVTNPVWVDDDHFDVGWHVRRSALPVGGGEEALAEFVGQEMSRRLDRSRPLWELTVVEGLPFNRVAILVKMHHALVDGMAAVDIGTVLLDPTPEPMDLAPESEWAPQPYDRTRHLARLARVPALQATKLLRDTMLRSVDPIRTAGDFKRAADLLTELARTRPAAPMTSLNRPIGPNRRYAMARADLAAVKAAGKAAGGTVNDTILAIVTGMLARALGPVDGSLVALVPVSVRREGDEGGNRISTVLVDLPVGERNPVRRIGQIHETMERIKASAAVRAGALMVGAGGIAPPLVSATLARAMSGIRAFNLVVSNVPGPQQPFYLNGSQLLAVHPAVPLNPASQGLTIGILSYAGQVCFGLLGDRDLDPPMSAISAALGESMVEVLGS